MIASLFATLRTQLQDASKPGLAGVRALEGAAHTVAALEDAVGLMTALTALGILTRLEQVERTAGRAMQYADGLANGGI